MMRTHDVSGSDASETEAKNVVREINPVDFVRNRVQQISQLMEVIDNKTLISGEVTKGPRTALQRLPRHIRRRAMSYNIKRFPRSARRFAKSAVANSKHRKKPPSRYYRRRPHNLLLNYIRRQKQHVWLETHIWHAKRFRMIKKWGYKLPLHSYQRSFRATYRDSKRHCTVQDASYLRCIQVFCAERSKLISILQALCAPETGATFSTNLASTEKFEIPVLLYEPGQYPHGLIGPVRIRWISMGPAETSLILWAHPSVSEHILRLLIRLLNLSILEKPQVEPNNGKMPKSLDEWRRMNNFIKMDSYVSPDGFKLFNLCDQLIRLRLRGPNSFTVLGNVIQTVSDSNFTEIWMKDFSEWNRFWDSYIRYQSPKDLTDCSIVHLLIEDPRLSRPLIKTLPKKQSSLKAFELKLNNLQRTNHLWNSQIRIEACKRKLSTTDIHLKRSENLTSPTTSPAKIPIDLIIRSGNNPSNLFVGVDIIAPPCFGMELWIALQFGTARATGLKDHLCFEFETERLYFPADIPDCCISLEEARNEKEELLERYEARPHNRRIKYREDLAILYPFSFEWAHLVREWAETVSPNSREPFVLRDKSALLYLNSWLLDGCRSKLNDDLLKKFSSALIPVRLRSLRTGCPQRFSIICIPHEQDLNGINCLSEKCILLEPRRNSSSSAPQEQELEQERKLEDLKDFISFDEVPSETTVSLNSLFPDLEILRNEARLAKRKAKRRKTKREDAGKEAEKSNFDRDSYRDSCSRTIIGRVVRGDYSFTCGKGCGLGYICLAAIEKIPKSLVLYRNSTSRHYHFARISILLTRNDL